MPGSVGGSEVIPVPARHGDHHLEVAAILRRWPGPRRREAVAVVLKEKSIGAEIDRLAELTGAPTEFVERIRALFSSKGISLDTDGAPYLSALEQAFRREQSVRVSAQHTRRNLERLQSQLSQFNDACRRQISRLRELQGEVESRAAARRPPEHGESRRIQIVEISEEDGLKVRRIRTVMVPGPKDMQ